MPALAPPRPPAVEEIAMTVTSVTAVAVSFRATSVSALSEPAEPAPPKGAAVAARRADTLVSRLDTDEDGKVSKDEFTAGAIDLLKRASVREHHRHVGRGDGIDKRDARWRARLERAFDRIDANGDGSLDTGEIAARLTPKGKHGKGAAQESEPASPGAVATTTTTSVTIVAIAIRRYTVDAGAFPSAPAQSQPADAAEAPTATPSTPQQATPEAQQPHASQELPQAA
jgi:hypothetical protein